MMIRKFIYTISVLSVFLAVSCDGALPEEGDGFGTAENESFVENPITDQNATRLWSTPALPDADGPVTISFKAGKTSPLKGYTGDVYAHIGILEYGTWKFVQADWNVNLPHCKFTPDP